MTQQPSDWDRSEHLDSIKQLARPMLTHPHFDTKDYFNGGTDFRDELASEVEGKTSTLPRRLIGIRIGKTGLQLQVEWREKFRDAHCRWQRPVIGIGA